MSYYETNDSFNLQSSSWNICNKFSIKESILFTIIFGNESDAADYHEDEKHREEEFN